MEGIDVFVVTFVLNAFWQVPAAVTAGLLGTACCGGPRRGCATPSGWPCWRSRWRCPRPAPGRRVSPLPEKPLRLSPHPRPGGLQGGLAGGVPFRRRPLPGRCRGGGRGTLGSSLCSPTASTWAGPGAGPGGWPAGEPLEIPERLRARRLPVPLRPRGRAAARSSALRDRESGHPGSAPAVDPSPSRFFAGASADETACGPRA